MTLLDDRDAFQTQRFALVGAGRLGELVLDLWPMELRRPEFVLDSTKQGMLRDLAICDLKTHRAVPNITYVMSVYSLPSVDAKAIFARLGDRPFLTASALLDRYRRDIFTNGWSKLSHDDEDVAKIARARACFTDSLSLQVMDAVVAWRYRNDLVDDYPICEGEDKYDLRLFARTPIHYDRIYDCGSTNLGLLDSLSAAGVQFDALVAFEPDPRHRQACLVRAAAWNAASSGSIEVRPDALCEKVGSDVFIANGLLSARLATGIPRHAADCVTVTTSTLDRVHGERFGWGSDPRVLIKLHAEGAELRALEGARRLITKTCADVFVDLSHDEVSLTEIPVFLSSLGIFDLFLRSHALFGEGLTLFARRKAG